MSNVKQVNATGAAVAGPVRLLSLALTHTAAASCTIRDGSGGTDVITLRCPANGSGSWSAVDKAGVQFADSVYVQTISAGTLDVEYA